MSDESVSTVARARPTPYKVWQRVLVWLAGSALGLGVAAVQIRHVSSLEDLLGAPFRYGFQSLQFLLIVAWLASAALVDKPWFLGWVYPAFFAWIWLWFATVIHGIGC